VKECQSDTYTREQIMSDLVRHDHLTAAMSPLQITYSVGLVRYTSKVRVY